MSGELALFLMVLLLGVAVLLGPMVASLIWGIRRLIRHHIPEGLQNEIAPTHELISQQLKPSAVVGEATRPDRRWFYLSEDGRAEPTSARVIQEMLRQGSASNDTLVWNETFGQMWKPIRETEIVGGTISVPPPFPPAVPPIHKKQKRWAGPIVVAIVLFWLFGGIGWLLEFGGVADKNMLNGQLPACDSAVTSSLIKEALENMPLSRIVHVSVIEVSGQHEVQFEYGDSSEKNIRHCAAIALMNSGKHAITYSLEWTAKKQNVYATVNLED
jgi:hypothetical protein